MSHTRLEYERYYRNPNVSNAHKLLDAILTEDYNPGWHQELIELHKFYLSNNHSTVKLLTSGTTSGVRTNYQFGPNPEFWIKSLETFTKFDRSKLTVIRTRHFDVSSRTDQCYISREGSCWFYNAFIIINRFSPRTVEMLCSVLDNVDGVLLANPNVWLYLTNSPLFVDYIISNRDRLSIASTNWEAFFKRDHLVKAGVLVNDTMINWYEGINFYTCKYGNPHSLPTFAINGDNVVNLLNLAGEPVALSDLVRVGGICQCGRKIVSVIPHYRRQPKVGGRYIYNTKMVESLRSAFYNLQFISSNRLNLFYSAESLVESDFDIIRSYVGDFWARSNSSWKIGDKHLSFYDGLDVGVYTDLSKSILM